MVRQRTILTFGRASLPFDPNYPSSGEAGVARLFINFHIVHYLLCHDTPYSRRVKIMYKRVVCVWAAKACLMWMRTLMADLVHCLGRDWLACGDGGHGRPASQ